MRKILLCVNTMQQSSQEWMYHQVHPKVMLRETELEELSGRSLYSLKQTWQQSFGSESWIWINHKTSGRVSFRQTRPKWRCTTSRLVKTKHNISTQKPHTNCQACWGRGDDVGLFGSHRTWTPCCHLADSKQWVIEYVCFCIFTWYSDEVWSPFTVLLLGLFLCVLWIYFQLS